MGKNIPMTQDLQISDAIEKEGEGCLVTEILMILIKKTKAPTGFHCKVWWANVFVPLVPGEHKEAHEKVKGLV